jgi:hypothetical protein
LSNTCHAALREQQQQQQQQQQQERSKSGVVRIDNSKVKVKLNHFLPRPLAMR